MMILVNKADYLTERQRIEWAKEFSRHNIKFAFYSAFNEQKVIDTKASHSLESELAELIVGVDNDDEDDDEDEDEDDEDEGTVAKEVKSTPVEKICEEETYHGIDYLLHG
jgi:large subunit GTPase 1